MLPLENATTPEQVLECLREQSRELAGTQARPEPEPATALPLMVTGNGKPPDQRTLPPPGPAEGGDWERIREGCALARRADGAMRQRILFGRGCLEMLMAGHGEHCSTCSHRFVFNGRPLDFARSGTPVEIEDPEAISQSLGSANDGALPENPAPVDPPPLVVAAPEYSGESQEAPDTSAPEPGKPAAELTESGSPRLFLGCSEAEALASIARHTPHSERATGVGHRSTSRRRSRKGIERVALDQANEEELERRRLAVAEAAGPVPVGVGTEVTVSPGSGPIDWRRRLITFANEKPRALLANAIVALEHAPAWTDVLGFDVFRFEVVTLRTTPWGGTPGAPWTDQEDRRTTEWLQCHDIYVPLEIAGQAVQTVAQARKFHPVLNYVDQLTWDGCKRIDQWLSLYLGVEPSDYSAAVGTRWLIQAIARVCRPGSKADCVIILEGPQGIKKSTAFRTLAEPWFTDEIADLGSKDSSLQTRGVWVIELSELDSMGRTEAGRIKAFMSRATDRFRPPYAKRLLESPRQCVFAGTVNHEAYLKDETGARRFWPVQCGRIEIDDLKRDRDQLWAETKARFDSGATWWIDSPELTRAASAEQQERFDCDPWEHLIAEWAGRRAEVSVTEILTSAIEKRKDLWTQVDKNRVARCLRAQGWERFRDRSEMGLEWRYRRKP